MLKSVNYSGQEFYTTGQVAKKLRISVSTLKRWITHDDVLQEVKINSNGWKLFSTDDIGLLKAYQKQKRKTGKQFNPSILVPVDQ